MELAADCWPVEAAAAASANALAASANVL